MLSNLLVDLFQTGLPFLYAVLVVFYGISFIGRARLLDAWKTRVLVAVIVMHLVYLGARTVSFDHPPITSVFEIMTILAAGISIAYLYIEVKTGEPNTGVFILFLAFVFQLVSSFFIRDLIRIPDYLHSRVLGFHVSTALLGYTGISLSAVYGLLYLMLYHDIRSSRFGIVYSRLPNLERLEEMSHRAEVFGFVMLGIAIVIGLIWLPSVFTDFSYLDPKLVATIVIWILYAVGLWAKKQFGWKGRKTMILTLIAFGIVFFSMTVVNIYLSEFHRFH